MITKTNSLNNINEITLTNLENGEVTLEPVSYTHLVRFRLWAPVKALTYVSAFYI